MACPPAGPWAAPLWATGPGSLCWSLCPPGGEATALRPITRVSATHPETQGEDSSAVPHSCHLAFVPQTRLGASSAPAMPSQNGTQVPAPIPAGYLWVEAGGSIFSPQTSSHEQQKHLKHRCPGLHTPSRLMCQEHLTKPHPKPPPPQPRTADVSLELRW